MIRKSMRDKYLEQNPVKTAEKACNCPTPVIPLIDSPTCPPQRQCKACPACPQTPQKSCDEEVQFAVQKYKNSQQNRQKIVCKNQSRSNENRMAQIETVNANSGFDSTSRNAQQVRRNNQAQSNAQVGGNWQNLNANTIRYSQNNSPIANRGNLVNPAFVYQSLTF